MTRLISVSVTLACLLGLPASAAAALAPATVNAVTLTRSADRETRGDSARWGKITSLPVRFQVQNRNGSKSPCTGDDGSYEVVGRIVGPKDVLAGGAIPSLSVYVHNIGWGAYAWNLQVPGYDHVTEMARRGHVSLVYDLLGYGASGRPPAGSICYGTEADVLAQMISQLRSTKFTVPGGVAPSVGRIAVVSQSIEGLTSQTAAYSFPGIDALVVTGWADQGQSKRLLTLSAQTNIDCGLPGSNMSADFGVKDFKDFYFADADDAVKDSAAAQRGKIPCGEPRSALATLVQDQVSIPTITSPVLLVYGTQDALFSNPRDAGAQQQALYRGSSDVTLSFVEGAGNALQLERSAPTFRSLLSAWLQKRGF